ncbi:MAG: cytochrome c1 [Betaproteobacteria bacterium]|jgi:ubiquinol-cytochrome c reductase cytochrome c1 subunit|nr:cytochrome c1 [Nitrosomonadales bacterium]NCV37899.1 cytochrome c1 [Betaproteobacteria bacterium]NCV54328.1 cytochrome c1 [Betaproteobacteria bacterium]
MKKFIAILISLLVSFHSSVTLSADSSYHLDKAKINLDDEQSLQRGARNFINYCLNCHSANYMRYNRLADIGLSDDVIKENLLFTADKTGELMDINMDSSEAKKWFGANPPNLTVTARSRGKDWIYSYLRTFYVDDSRELGWNNLVYPNAAMPHVLWELQGIQNLEDNKLKLNKPGLLSTEEYDQFVLDTTNYMVFMSEPAKLVRHKIGYYVIGFLLILLILVINLKKEFWKDVK